MQQSSVTDGQNNQLFRRNNFPPLGDPSQRLIFLFNFLLFFFQIFFWLRSSEKIYIRISYVFLQVRKCWQANNDNLTHLKQKCVNNLSFALSNHSCLDLNIHSHTFISLLLDYLLVLITFSSHSSIIHFFNQSTSLRSLELGSKNYRRKQSLTIK